VFYEFNPNGEENIKIADLYESKWTIYKE
jgi:hypothetical protein